MDRDTTVTIKESTLRKLQLLKIELRFGSMDSLINGLIDLQKEWSDGA